MLAEYIADESRGLVEVALDVGPERSARVHRVSRARCRTRSSRTGVSGGGL